MTTDKPQTLLDRYDEAQFDLRLAKHDGRNVHGCLARVTALREQLAAALQAEQPGTSVPVPLNEDQAALMVGLGMDWLQQHAPHRLVHDKPKPVLAYRVDWPIENSVGMRRLYSAEDWDVHKSTVKFFGGKPVALVEQGASVAPQPTPVTDAVCREKARLWIQAGRSWRGYWDPQVEQVSRAFERLYQEVWRECERFHGIEKGGA